MNRTTIPAIEELPRALSIAEQRLVDASNEFAFGVFREIDAQDDPGNRFISPLSMSMALGMTYNGAAANTAAQMADVLGLDELTVQEANEAYRDLIDLLLDLDGRVEMGIANSIWHRTDVTVERAFLDTNREYFDARVSALDFGDPGASQIINDWVKDQTRGRIEKIVPDDIAGFVMFLINAVYFKADWTTQFDKSRTRDEPFTLPDGTTRNVPMMYHGRAEETTFRVTTGDGASVIDLPYGGDAFTMTLVLPDPGTSVDDLVGDLDEARWNAWIGALTEQRVHVVLPRFELEYEIELKSVLEAMGMTDAFAPGRADFSRMRSGGGLWIDHVKHKTFVKVDEEGTEAAAVTSVAIVESAPPTLRFDRPFVLAIRERFSGTILFLGKIVDPS